ncbi:hypothetical protein LXT12_05770 [Pelomonas sp. P7]|uniref:DUF559 domain-containing protein n=1 Tax=Pelomonas caseinilytica TaxID=2906763 RepID=A0ABS8X7Z2_9BURK|nr:hypothetical protein [Pelomonas sp. P7]MCE4536756.1 hypothetical protein [Pelomonas sp. P7]
MEEKFIDEPFGVAERRCPGSEWIQVTGCKLVFDIFDKSALQTIARLLSAIKKSV